MAKLLEYDALNFIRFGCTKEQLETISISVDEGICEIAMNNYYLGQ